MRLSKLESDVRTDFLKELISCIKQHSKEHLQSGTTDRSVLDAAYRHLHEHLQERREQFEALPTAAVCGGMTVGLLAELAANTAVLYLNGLIGFLYRMHQLAYQNISEGRFMTFLHHEEELFRFSVMDLLRAKCSASLPDLKKVIAKLYSNHSIKLVRVKNRLSTGNRDFLINFTFGSCPLICELQIGLKDSADEKSAYQDHYNHFLYELARSKFGPLSECALIVAYQNDVGAYFKKKTKRVKIKRDRLQLKPESVGGVMKIAGFEQISSDCVFLCSNCLEVSSSATKLLGCWKKRL